MIVRDHEGDAVFSIQFHHRELRRDGTPDEWIDGAPRHVVRATVCTVTPVVELSDAERLLRRLSNPPFASPRFETFGPKSEGVAFCSRSDQFNKARGRKLSLARALEFGLYPKDIRTMIWKFYLANISRGGGRP